MGMIEDFYRSITGQGVSPVQARLATVAADTAPASDMRAALNSTAAASPTQPPGATVQAISTAGRNRLAQIAADQPAYGDLRASVGQKPMTGATRPVASAPASAPTGVPPIQGGGAVPPGGMPPSGGLPPGGLPPEPPSGPLGRLATAAKTYGDKARSLSNKVMNVGGKVTNVAARGAGVYQAAQGVDELIDNPTNPFGFSPAARASQEAVKKVVAGSTTAVHPVLGAITNIAAFAAPELGGALTEGAYNLGRHLPLVRRLYDQENAMVGPELRKLVRDPNAPASVDQRPTLTEFIQARQGRPEQPTNLSMQQMLAQMTPAERAAIEADMRANLGQQGEVQYTKDGKQSIASLSTYAPPNNGAGNRRASASAGRKGNAQPPLAAAPATAGVPQEATADAQAAQTALDQHPIQYVSFGSAADGSGTSVGQISYRDGTTVSLERGQPIPEDVKQWMALSNRAAAGTPAQAVDVIRPGNVRSVASPEYGYQEVPQAIAQSGQTDQYIRRLSDAYLQQLDPLAADRLKNEGTLAVAQEQGRTQQAVAGTQAATQRYVSDQGTTLERQKAGLMQELNNPGTSDERKRDIEFQLGLNRFVSSPISKDAMGNVEYGLVDTRRGTQQGPKQNFPTPSSASVARLKKYQSDANEVQLFESVYGPGSAAQYLKSQ